MSLKKIAEMVGTSPSTVSRVLNQTSNTCASKELSERIWAAAREIDYRPNESARSLRKKETAGTEQVHISVVMARFHELKADPFFEELMGCLRREFFVQNVSPDQLISEEAHLEDIPPAQGVIVLGRCSAQMMEEIQSRTRNIVGIWRNSMEFDVDEVICDGRKAAEMAVDYLYSLGHRKIAYIGSCSHESRYVGYCNQLIMRGLPMDYGLIKPTDQTCESADAAIRELLEAGADFSAIFCANDTTAIRVLQVLKEQKRQIKRRISVISIDNIEESANTDPYLTSIQIPREEMAHMAVQLLLDRLKGGHKEMARIEFPCRIVQRDSCYEVD